MNIAWRDTAQLGLACPAAVIVVDYAAAHMGAGMYRDVGTGPYYFFKIHINPISISDGSDFSQHKVACPPLEYKTFRRPC